MAKESKTAKRLVWTMLGFVIVITVGGVATFGLIEPNVPTQPVEQVISNESIFRK